MFSFSIQFKKVLIVIAVAALLGGGGIFVWKGEVTQNGDLTVEAAREEQKKNTAKPITGEPNLPAPRLDRPVTVTARLSEMAAEEAKKRIAELTAELKDNPEFYSDWVELGIYRKMIGDYVSAREAWEYASMIAPLESVPFNNLANLYIYFLNDFTKGEEYLLETLERAPNSLVYYENAYEFYALIKKDPAKAREVLERGIIKSPENEQALRDLLSRVKS